MVHMPGYPDAAVAEIGEDYVLLLDERGNVIVRISGISPAQMALTDDAAGEELLEARLRGVRRRRDALLDKSDKAMVPDRPMSEERREAWRAYRQALRDLPEQVIADNMYTTLWPEPPA